MKRLLLVFLFAALAPSITEHAEAQAIIIVNPSVKAAQVSRSDLRDVFTGVATNLKDGSHVTPVLLKGGPANDEFLKAYIGKSDVPYKASWRSLVFSGQASMPKTFDSESAVVEYVAHNAGAIGYIQAGTPHEGVKVLSVK